MKKSVLLGSLVLSALSFGATLQMQKIGHFQGAESGKGGPIDMVEFYNNTLFVANGTNTATQPPSLDIVDLSGLKTGQKEFALSKRIDAKTLIPGITNILDVTCIKVSPDGKFIAMTVAANPITDRGWIVITDLSGKYLAHYTVGSLPDNLAITPDSKKILVANEGEPGKGLQIDPEGTISIIDLTKGITKGEVTEIKIQDSLIKGEVKVALDEYILASPHKPTYSQALEPEYITVDKDGKFAYVVFQEESAIGKLDIANKKFLWLDSMGYKDHSKAENAMAIGKDNPNLVTANVLGMYQPDGISLVQRGQDTYILTANEGDARDYGRDLFREDASNIGDLIKNGAVINVPVTEEMKNLRVNQYRGKNSKGEYDKLFSFGARSFSILKIEKDGVKMIFDSGKEMEEITKELLPQYFNADNKDNKAYGRNGTKGPEPEDITVGVVDGKTYAFIGLERVGGLITYDITNIEKPVYSGYFTSRDFSDKIAGDVGIEGLKFVDAKSSPTGKALILAANEISNSVAIYEVTTK